MERSSLLQQFAEADLYVVITADFCAGRSSLEVLEGALQAGVRLVQLREKKRSDQALYDLGLVWRERTRQAGALFIVDDRVDIALAVQADGVHLGQTDLPIGVARALAPDLIIGGSSHSVREALDIERAGADYVNIGPIYATQTKSVATGAVGPELVKEVRDAVRIPFTCMGGITLNTVDEVVAHGARMVAVVTAVTAASDVCEAAAALRNRILIGRNQQSRSSN